MPEETQEAVNWALGQTFESEGETRYVVTDGLVDRQLLVDTVRQYFEENDIGCLPMNAGMLDPYLPQ